ncbi:MAG TPA: hypothetical protein VK034_31625, partial [Enhygromyxa sp.]|nr:hypothetical protein [Enhygromyxa sp.]
SVAPEPDDSTTPTPDPGSEPSSPIGVCGTAGQHFGDYHWVPDDSRLTTSILRGDPQLADALRMLASAADDERMQLPIRAAIDYRHLGAQLAGLERVIASVELDPGELVELHGPDGDVVWLWPTDCPLATLATRTLDRFAVLIRADFGNPGVRIGEGSIEQFPFDLVLVRERFVALAPLGRGARIGEWLNGSAHDDDGPGVALAGIEPAPIRSVLSGPALLAGPELDRSPTSGRHRRIRATASACYDVDTTPQP